MRTTGVPHFVTLSPNARTSNSSSYRATCPGASASTVCRMIAQVRLARTRPGVSVRASSKATARSEIEAGFVFPADVRQLWLCRLKPSAGCRRSRSAFSTQAFRRLQQQRVAVDVEPLRVAPLEPLRTVGVEHRHEVNRQLLQQPLHRRLRLMAGHDVKDVEQRAGGGRLVAVHLRPQQHVHRAAPEPHVVDGAAFDRLADRLHFVEPFAALDRLVEVDEQAAVIEQRGRAVVDVLGLPHLRDAQRVPLEVLRRGSGRAREAQENDEQGEGEAELVIAGTR